MSAVVLCIYFFRVRRREARKVARALWADFRRAMICRKFFACVLIVPIILLLSSLDVVLAAFRAGGPLGTGFHIQFLKIALDSEAMSFCAPILCALPFTAAFTEDMSSGFIRAYLPRTSVNRYIRSKNIACAISGGLSLALGILCAYALSAMLFLPREVAPVAGGEIPPVFPDIMGTVGLFFLSGAFWSLTGLLFATFTGSKYMAYASPFVLFYVLIILCERYFPDLYALYPREWMNPTDKWRLGSFGVILILSVLITVASVGFYFAAKRRIRSL